MLKEDEWERWQMIQHTDEKNGPKLYIKLSSDAKGLMMTDTPVQRQADPKFRHVNNS